MTSTPAPLPYPTQLVPATTTPTSPAASASAKLGKLMRTHTKLLQNLGWPAFVKQLQFPSDHPANLSALPHPAASLLQQLALHGVPAPSSSPPWSYTKLSDVLRRGAHSSAQHQYRNFLIEDMLDMVEKGYWAVLPFSILQHYTHLKLSPEGVVPQ
jgi:hypothetical protein